MKLTPPVVYQSAMVTMAFFHQCPAKHDAVFFSTADIRNDHVEENILVANPAIEAEAQIILAGPVALEKYNRIPLDFHGYEVSHVLRLAQNKGFQPVNKFNEWHGFTRCLLFELSWPTLILAEHLQTAGALSGAQVASILRPFTSYWHGAQPSPVTLLRIVRSEDCFQISAQNFLTTKPKHTTDV